MEVLYMTWNYEKYNKIVKEWIEQHGTNMVSPDTLSDLIIKTFGANKETRSAHYDGLKAHGFLKAHSTGATELIADPAIPEGTPGIKEVPEDVPEGSPDGPAEEKPEVEAEAEAERNKPDAEEAARKAAEPQDEKPEEAKPEAGQ